MEMEKVPASGYEIKGLWISGIQRKMSLSNFIFPLKLISSLWKARQIIHRFKPDVVVGTGGFASGPTLWMASAMGIPTLIQEQNSYPGITNKFLAGKARKICVAYDGLERFFPKEKIVKTGNPVRRDLLQLPAKEEALRVFDLEDNRKTLLVLGGSLGAAVINKTLESHLDYLLEQGVQILWQTGKLYYERYHKYHSDKVHVTAFIDRMDAAYAVADVIISRAGAGTISELALVGKPVLFIPSPNVAEDHQRKNAEAIVQKKAAWMLKESELDLFAKTMNELINNDEECRIRAMNLKKTALPRATEDIVDQVEELIQDK
jgi:UDP-N-acetylglucosamine--N-acetylmuramyl-(pentapeptide) pyrophosphoryl-undecaprenol N-acetylglucosamine transferase